MPQWRIRRARSGLVGLIGLAALCACSPAWGQRGREGRPEPAEANARPAGRTVVLDTAGFWRMHHSLKPPVIQHDNGPKPMLLGEAWLDIQTSPPPAGWTAVEFDDAGWVRAVALRASKSPYLAHLAMRGEFLVTDPQKVKDLKLTLGYHGGAVAYLNGKEIGRGHLPAGAPGDPPLAEGYGEEVYVLPDGRLIARRVDGPDRARRIGLRERTLELDVPSGLLRPGLNVLAVELVRAPYHKIIEVKTVPDRAGKPQVAPQWNTCEIRRVQLSAAGAEGLVPNATRPPGLQAWNSDVLASDFDLDFGDPRPGPGPVKIVGARNGGFCGKIVVGSDQPIRGLKVTVSDLTSGPAVIPASAVRVRYALPWGDEYLVIPYHDQVYPYPRQAGLLSALVDWPPQEVPVRQKPARGPRYELNLPNQPEPVVGAVVPVWMSVQVPAGAKPGLYTGQVRVAAEGAKTIEAAVELTVADWALPDTQDYKTWVELIESPDTLAMEYAEPLWSERHWKMIEQAFRIIGGSGSRVVHVPLLAQTNLGHEQTMVRWTRKGPNQYDYDFTILDRYLDAAQKHMGTPKMVVFWVWDIYLIEKEKYQGRDHLILEQAIAARESMRGTGPMVTVLDPAGGATETVSLPPYKDPASKALWAPLMAAIRQRLQARGLEKAMFLGMMNDTLPSKAELEFWAELCPGVPWALQAHGGPKFGPLLGTRANLGYKAIVWTLQFSANRSLHGWNSPNLLAYYDRDRDLSPHSPLVWGHMAEVTITGNQRGVGRLGGDYWPAVKDKTGRRVGYAWTRYPHSSWRNLDLWSYALAPGPDGPVATTRFETFREGVQHCEARIFIETALLDKDLRAKLGEDLAERCQKALDDRQIAMVMGLSHHQMYDTVNAGIRQWRSGVELAGYMWFLNSGWQDRSRLLYDLAGQVARAIGRP